MTSLPNLFPRLFPTDVTIAVQIADHNRAAARNATLLVVPTIPIARADLGAVAAGDVEVVVAIALLVQIQPAEAAQAVLDLEEIGAEVAVDVGRAVAARQAGALVVVGGARDVGVPLRLAGAAADDRVAQPGDVEVGVGEDEEIQRDRKG